MYEKPKKSDLPQADTDTKEIGTLQNMLKKKPKNNSEETPIVSGTNGVMKENAVKLTRYVVKILSEDARTKRHKLTYNTVLCQENNGSRTSVKLIQRDTLAEAIADIEECLQFNNSSDVKLNVNYMNENNVSFTKVIPMIDVKKHRPLMAEGKHVFRLAGNARLYATGPVNESKATKVSRCAYGYAVNIL